MPMVLPPGVGERDFSTAIDAFREVAGDGNVWTEPEELERYRDPYPPSGPSVNRASAAVAPGSVEEVQEILRIANRTGVPLSVISTQQSGLRRWSSAPVWRGGARHGQTDEPCP